MKWDEEKLRELVQEIRTSPIETEKESILLDYIALLESKLVQLTYENSCLREEDKPFPI